MVAQLRSLLLLKRSWDPMLTLLEQSPSAVDQHVCVRRELTLIRREVLDQLSIGRLVKALSSGGPIGSVLRLDTSTIEVREIDAAIRYSEDVRCESPRCRSLVEIASDARKMRLALLQRDYVAMGASADHMATSLEHGGFLSEIDGEGEGRRYEAIRRELWLVQDILDNVAVARYLRKGLREGRIEGEPGLLYNVVEEGMGVKGGISGDVHTHIPEEKTNTYKMRRGSAVMQASHFFQDGGDSDAATSGRFSNHSGGADTLSASSSSPSSQQQDVDESCSSLVLRDAMRQAEGLDVRTKEVEVLLVVGRHVARLRDSLRPGGGGVQTASSLCSEESERQILSREHVHVLGDEDARVVAAEIRLVRSDLRVREAVLLLRSSLTSGSATCMSGSIDLSTLELRRLDEALWAAREAGVMEGEGRRLLVAAIGLRNVRAALLAGPDWEAVEIALMHMEEDTEELDNSDVVVVAEKKKSTGSRFLDTSGVGGAGGGGSSKDEKKDDTVATPPKKYESRRDRARREKAEGRGGGSGGGDNSSNGGGGGGAPTTGSILMRKNATSANTLSASTASLPRPTPHVLIANEVHEIRTEMFLHGQMEAILHSLEIGIETNDLTLLEETLTKATSLGMEASSNLHHVTLVYRCREIAHKLRGARARLRESLDSFYGNITVTELERGGRREGRDTLASTTVSSGRGGRRVVEDWSREEREEIPSQQQQAQQQAQHSSFAKNKKKKRIMELRISVPNQLRQALLYSERVGYDKSPLGIEVSGILAAMSLMEERARVACAIGDVDEIVQILQESHAPVESDNQDRIGYRSQSDNDWNNGVKEGVRCPMLTRETQIKCRQLLQLPLRRLHQLRLRSAIQRDDVNAIVSATVDIKTLFFDEHPNKKMLELESLPCLRSSSQQGTVGGATYTSPRGIRSPSSRTSSPLSASLSRSSSPLGVSLSAEEEMEVSSKLLSFSEIPISTSLMKMRSRQDIEVSMKMFKNVLGFMGDRSYTYPQTLARELLEACLLHPPLRDELYLQIIKQVRNNLNVQSQRLGYLLLDMCLQSFPPSEKIENTLEYFLRRRVEESGLTERERKQRSEMVRSLHLIVYQGPREETDLPSLVMIEERRKQTTEVLRVEEVQERKKRRPPAPKRRTSTITTPSGVLGSPGPGPPPPGPPPLGSPGPPPRPSDPLLPSRRSFGLDERRSRRSTTSSGMPSPPSSMPPSMSRSREGSVVNNPLGIGPPPSGPPPDKGGIGQSGVSGPPLTPI